jgi:hypothetical protein
MQARRCLEILNRVEVAILTQRRAQAAAIFALVS